MRQISIFIENETGKLAEVVHLLAKENINLRALTIADTSDYGILRIVTDKTDEANSVLLEHGYLTKVNDVLTVKMEDKPGSIVKILAVLSKENISVEYTYAFTSSEPGYALMVFRVNDNDKAKKALSEAGLGVSL